jgi:hypothetical protein
MEAFTYRDIAGMLYSSAEDAAAGSEVDTPFGRVEIIQKTIGPLNRARWFEALSFIEARNLSRQAFVFDAYVVLCEDVSTPQYLPFIMTIHWLETDEDAEWVLMRAMDADGNVLIEQEIPWLCLYVGPETGQAAYRHMASTWSWPPDGRAVPLDRIAALFTETALPTDYETSWRDACAHLRREKTPPPGGWPRVTIPLMPPKGVRVEIRLRDREGLLSNVCEASVGVRTSAAGSGKRESLKIEWGSGMPGHSGASGIPGTPIAAQVKGP